eukprot:1781876-Rhodomonas_salina.1
MTTSRTPLVKNLFGKRLEQESSSSSSEPEADAIEDPESETPQVVPLIDLSSPEPEEAGGKTGAGSNKRAVEGLVLCRLPGCLQQAFVDTETGKESEYCCQRHTVAGVARDVQADILSNNQAAPPARAPPLSFSSRQL